MPRLEVTADVRQLLTRGLDVQRSAGNAPVKVSLIELDLLRGVVSTENDVVSLQLLALLDFGRAAVHTGDFAEHTGNCLRRSGKV